MATAQLLPMSIITKEITATLGNLPIERIGPRFFMSKAEFGCTSPDLQRTIEEFSEMFVRPLVEQLIAVRKRGQTMELKPRREVFHTETWRGFRVLLERIWMLNTDDWQFDVSVTYDPALREQQEAA